MSDVLLLTCPHCLRRNRVPATRLADGATCGACKQALTATTPLTLTTASFAAHADGGLPLVVDFWATWCGPCQQFAPTFAAAAAQLAPQVRLGKVDTDAEPALSQRFNIRSIPTLILFRDGREVTRVAGAMPQSAFIQWVRKSLADSGSA